MQINLEFDANALAAPQSFRDAIQQAANIIDSTFTDAITVNISVGYGELTADGQTETLASGSAETETLDYVTAKYSTIRGILLNSVQSNVLSGVQALPATTTLQGHSRVQVWAGEAKALGLLSPTGTELDSAVGFATDIQPGNLVGVALHELTHAMGRASGDSANEPTIFDFYRYTGVGALLFGSALPSAASYFSLDGGQSDIADYGQNYDPADFLNNGKAPYDPFEEIYVAGTHQYLTALDLEQMEALGFHTTAQTVLGNFSAGPNLYWESSAGAISLWELNGTAAATAVNLPSAPGWQVQDVGDFNGDGLAADLVLRNTTSGMVDIWTDVNGRMSGADVVQATLDWNIMGTGDFNGDGKSDILWRNEQNGYVSIWLMNGTQVQSTWNPGNVDLSWHIVGDGDYNGDGRADILWRNANSGEVDIWTLNPSTGQASGAKVATLGLEWQVIGQGDFNGDGKTDILWRDTSDGQIVIWEMNGAQVLASEAIANLGAQWRVAEVVDANDDGKADIVWLDAGTGETVLWAMNGFNIQQSAVLGTMSTAFQPINHHFDWI